MFRIFHNATQSISTIAEMKSRNIHNHVFFSTIKSEIGPELALGVPEDFLGGRLFGWATQTGI